MAGGVDHGTNEDSAAKPSLRQSFRIHRARPFEDLQLPRQQGGVHAYRECHRVLVGESTPRTSSLAPPYRTKRSVQSRQPFAPEPGRERKRRAKVPRRRGVLSAIEIDDAM